MNNREEIITHLQIINTWAAFARKRDLQFFTAKHLEDIVSWTDDALALLKEQSIKQNKQKVITFSKVRVSLPMKDRETKEEIEDRFIEAVDSIGEGVVMSFKTSIEEYDD